MTLSPPPSLSPPTLLFELSIFFLHFRFIRYLVLGNGVLQVGCGPKLGTTSSPPRGSWYFLFLSLVRPGNDEIAGTFIAASSLVDGPSNWFFFFTLIIRYQYLHWFFPQNNQFPSHCLCSSFPAMTARNFPRSFPPSLPPIRNRLLKPLMPNYQVPSIVPGL